MSSKPSSKPEWIPSDDPAKIIEPSISKKNAGWGQEEKPPFQYFNWFWNNLSKWMDYVSDLNISHTFDTEADMSASTDLTANGTAKLLGKASIDDGGQGYFVGSTADLSVEVAADTASGIYVAPDSDPTGASGAWVRNFTGARNIDWYGGDLAAAVAQIDTTKAILGIYSPVVIDSGTTVTTPVTMTLEFKNSGSIDGIAGGGTETLTVNGKINVNTWDGVFGVNLTVTETNSLKNVGLGLYTLLNSTSASHSNTVMGARVLKTNTTGYENTAVGFNSMFANVDGYRNTAYGAGSLEANIDGHHNCALGQNALAENLHGVRNTALGIDALRANIGTLDGLEGSFNVAVGQFALLENISGISNTSTGYQSMYSSVTGNSNAAYGNEALFTQDGVTGNTAFGAKSGKENISGVGLTIVGYRAGQLGETGDYNNYFGDQAGYKCTSGSYNCVFGFTSLYENLTSSLNSAFGHASLYFATGGSNTGFGAWSGYSLTTGSDCTFVGDNAGFHVAQKVDATNSTAIGANSFTTQDNIVQLGDTDVDTVGVGVNKMSFGVAAPTTGTSSQGDVIWNTGVTAGSSPGWSCTESGTFGAATDSTGDTVHTGTSLEKRTITGMTDTSDFFVGNHVDVSAGFATTGPYRIVSKTVDSIEINNEATSTESNITVNTSDPVFKAMANVAA